MRSVSQVPWSVSEPAQVMPPLEGAGFVQVLVLDQVPCSQVTEHPAQAPQAPQLPLIGPTTNVPPPPPVETCPAARK